MAIEVVRYPRGSVPLILSLEEAFEIVRNIYEQPGGIASADMMSRLLGNSASSSSFIKKVNALRTYGLIEQENGNFTLTETGGAIAAPTGPEMAAAAKRDAFLKIDVFAKVFERHKGKLLPADEFLKNIIEQDCKIPKDLSSTWVEAFKKSARIVELLFDRGDGKTQIMETPILRFPRIPPVAIEPTEQRTDAIVPVKGVETQGTAGTVTVQATGHTTRIELSNKRQAVFSIPDSLTKRDAQKLKSALRGFEAIIDSMISEETDGAPRLP